MNVSHNTVDGTYKDPCTTVGGIRTGSPCTFPFVFPDCSEYFKPYQQIINRYLFIHLTSWPYFGLKLSCVCLYETVKLWFRLTFRGTKWKNLFNKKKKENYLFIYWIKYKRVTAVEQIESWDGEWWWDGDTVVSWHAVTPGLLANSLMTAWTILSCQIKRWSIALIQ